MPAACLRKLLLLVLLRPSAAFNSELSCSGLMDDGIAWDVVRARTRALLHQTRGSCPRKWPDILRLQLQQVPGGLSRGSRCPLGQLTGALLHSLYASGGNRAVADLSARSDDAVFDSVLTILRLLQQVSVEAILWSTWPLFGVLSIFARCWRLWDVQADGDGVRNETQSRR
eukprot:TRINITY_DN116109_c0_g1_i1.p1 TRINITY_DN116109_c0_g1~~TRINITY_DN116109_c0_g1_i1.p1  ORF type:complete len:197 (+),score=18.79 TRINITY_DN116109_c0_g1_i1:79-591(+)